MSLANYNLYGQKDINLGYLFSLGSFSPHGC
jgi:hypothetical protein